MFKINITLILSFLLFSCTKEQKPEGAIPQARVYPPQEITRNSALLQGEVTTGVGVDIRTCEFVCMSASDGKEAQRITVDFVDGSVQTTVDGLTAGHTYNYYLEVSNGFSQVTSGAAQFTTLPNTAPVLGTLEQVGVGPVSAFLQCQLLDDGGLPTETGFLFTEKTTGIEQKIQSHTTDEKVFAIRKNDLQPESTYLVCAYSSNALGQTNSEVIEIKLSSAVHLSEPGMLAELLEGNGKYALKTFTIAGKLNGTDIRLLRDLLGRDMSGAPTSGKLEKLDLFDAVIVEGGLNYMDSRYTENNTLSYGMFKGCTTLKELILPFTLQTIDQSALEDCSSLIALQIPASVTTFTPSSGCTALQEISISPQNKNFSSVNGVLYNKAGTELLFYPQGRIASSFTVPETVKTIKEYAFQYSPISTLYIPNNVETLGKYTFYASDLEEIVLSDAISTIPYAAFQQCSKLKKVTLGTSTMLLSEYCFDGCPLTDLCVWADYPPVRNSLSFTSSDIFKDCILYVPAGCRSLYRSSTSWKDFLRIVEK